MTSEEKPSQSKPPSAITKFMSKHSKEIAAIAQVALPKLIRYSRKAHASYKKIPKDYVHFLFGFIVCFFGGVYPVLFAAIEAARHGGLANAVKSLSDLADEALIIIEASKKDDELDEDGDGIADVDEISAARFVVRKTNLVVRKINPEKVNAAIGVIYKVWMAVLACLSVKFARTVAFAESICDFIRKPTYRFVIPPILAIIPVEYHRWVPVLVNWATKSVSITIAFYLKSVSSALTSALTGALLMTRALMTMAAKNDWDFGGLLPKDHKDTMIDEYASYVIAFLGFRFQWQMNFDVPFPFNVILFPLEVTEWVLRNKLVKR